MTKITRKLSKPKNLNSDTIAAFAKVKPKQASADPSEVRMTAHVSDALHRKLKARAAVEGVTIGRLIEQWIESWD